MIGIIGGGLAAAKTVESYREAGGTDEIVLWSQDPHGPYNRPPLTKRLLRGESKPEDALIALEGVDLRLGERVESLDARPVRRRASSATRSRSARSTTRSTFGAGPSRRRRRRWSAAASSAARSPPRSR